MRRSAFSGLIVATGLVACHPNRALELPPAAGAGSLLLIVARNGDLDIVWATDIAEPKYPELSGNAALELTAIEFCCSLSVLGLQPGVQVLREAPQEKPLLPAPENVFAAAVDGESQSPWQPADGLGTHGAHVLDRLDLPEDHLCDLYSVPLESRDATLRAVGTSSTPSFGVRLADGTAFVATLSGIFIHVQEEDDEERPPMRLTELSTTTPHHAGFLRTDGEIFLLGKDGAFARGDLTRGFTAHDAGAAGGASQHVRLDGAKDGPVELFAVSDARAFQRFDGTRWTTLSTASAVPVDDNMRSVQRPAIAYVGPNEALATQIHPTNRRAVVRYKDGVMSADEAPFASGDESPAEIYNIPGWGVIAGSDRGRISFRRADGTWSEGTRVSNARVRAIVPLGSALFIYSLFASTGGANFAQYHPRAGACPAKEPYTSGYIRHMLPLGERSILLLAVNMSDPDDLVQMTILEKKGEIAPCLEATK